MTKTPNVALLSHQEATERLAEVEEETKHAREWRTTLRDAEALLEERLAALPSKYERDRNDLMLEEELNEGLAELRHGGVTPLTGQSRQIPKPIRLDKKPGLDEVKDILRDLKTEATALRAHLDLWADETMTRPYTFVGSKASGTTAPGLAFFDGRVLEVGDVVQLNRSQAVNMADRFKPGGSVKKKVDAA